MDTHVPERMCVACRARRPQETLIRVVRTPQGQARVDQDRHRAAGRGAYLCAEIACIQRAEQRQALRRTLQCAVSAQVMAELRQVAAARAGAAPGDRRADSASGN